MSEILTSGQRFGMILECGGTSQIQGQIPSFFIALLPLQLASFLLPLSDSICFSLIAPDKRIMLPDMRSTVYCQLCFRT